MSEHTDQTSIARRAGKTGRRPVASRPPSQWFARILAIAALPLLMLAAGCGGGVVSSSSSNGTFSVSPGTATIDTNCTGCNTSSTSGTAVEQFTATLNSGGSANVSWSVSPSTGAGTINSSGQYTPPSYLSADSVKATVTATLTSSPSATATAALTITPGFLQPLTPENFAMGANGTATIVGYIAEVGGSTVINYAVSSTSTGSSGGQGSVGSPACTRSANSFTSCTVTYTAPGTVSSTASTYVVATVGSSSSKVAAEVLLNTAGISSNPDTHQAQEPTAIALGTSGGNNNDYDTQPQNGQTVITDCCGGTLGSLIQNSNGAQYLLSNNHVLARSDQASTGEAIIQPGLIDDNCQPTNGFPAGTETPVGVLTAWLPLSASTTNADAAIAQVNSGAVNSTGAIEELGTPQNGTLAAAPPGTSSTGGKGESPTVNMVVAKSGRTTGLTCASISAISATIQVEYFKDCAETQPYLTKTYTNQIEIAGNEFSDAGDSGSLVVDTTDAEPVGLFFAGGVDQSGQSHGIANPVSTVLSELGSQQGTTFTFVGAADHPVSCLNYGAGTATAAQAGALTSAQTSLAQHALAQARMLVNPSTGILGADVGKSNDRAGDPAVILYVDQNTSVAAPQTINGVRTEVIPTTEQAVAASTAPHFPLESGASHRLASDVLTEAISAKQQVEQSLMKQNPAIFGIGVGQSFDNPDEAALVIYVDRKQIPASLPATINGLRTRYIIMDRLHVTRSYQTGAVRQQGHCMSHPASNQSFNPLEKMRLRDLNLH